MDNNGPKDPFGKAVYDVDGDGLTDLVVGGFTSGGLVWYKNPGDPLMYWKKFLITDGIHFKPEYEVADIDGDGIEDLVVLQGEIISWYRNDGSPEEGGWEQTLISETGLHDIEVADFDNDGDVDVIGRNQSNWDKDGNIIHFFDQIKPDIWAHTTLVTDHGEGLYAIDLDNDGKKDIVTGNKWYKNDGTMDGAGWEEFLINKAWAQPNVYIDCGDINGDGLTDITLVPSEPVDEHCRISWFEHPENLSNEWTEHVMEDSVQCDYHFAGCADFDMDGKLDIAMAEMHHGDDPDEVMIYRNNGKGESWSKNILWDRGSHSCCIFDCDNDGDPDLFGANYRGEQVNLWVNQAIRPAPLVLDKWHYIQLDSARNAHVMGLAMADLNGDGNSEILSGKWVYFNPGGNMAGEWQRKTLPLNADILLTVNVDDDEHADLIAEDCNGNIYWIEMTDTIGDEWYYRQIGNVRGANHQISSQGYCLADVEAGGKPEIIILGGDRPLGAIYYLKVPADPENMDWPIVMAADSVYPDGIGSGDIDGDGDIDFCAPSDIKDKSAWYENPGNGDENWKKHEVGGQAGSDRYGMADVDGDGRIDIVVTGANRDDNGLFWFKAPENPKSGIWMKNVIVGTGSENTMNSMDLADMDRDGDIDIVTGTHRGELKVSVWGNNGVGTFKEHITGNGIESHLGARLFDLDGDGDLDIVSMAWDKYQYLHVWRNDAFVK